MKMMNNLIRIKEIEGWVISKRARKKPDEGRYVVIHIRGFARAEFKNLRKAMRFAETAGEKD